MIGNKPFKFGAVPFKQPHNVMTIVSETADGLYPDLG